MTAMPARRERRAAGSFGAMTEERHPHDLYETPPEAVEMLCANLWRERAEFERVWDPSCGRGAILKALRNQRHIVIDEIYGSDKFRYDDRLEGVGVDRKIYVTQGPESAFENYTVGPASVIVMNPPYGQADEHVRHAIRLIPRDGIVCALLRWNWITAMKRRDLLPHLTNAIIVGRLKMLPPNVEDKGHSGTVDFAWFVFCRPLMSDRTRIVRA